jgi:hypothetical protein
MGFIVGIAIVIGLMIGMAVDCNSTTANPPLKEDPKDETYDGDM